MKKILKILVLSLILCLCSSVVACGGDNKNSSKVDFQLSESMEVIVGVESKISYTLTGTDEKVVFTSSDENIATVSDDGIVKGVNAGKCTINAKVNNIEKQCAVTVKLHSSAPVLSLNNKTVNLHVNDEYILVPELTHLDKIVNVPFTFESENNEIVSVNSEGRIKAINLGKSKIKISYSYLGYSETVEVNVNVIENIEMELSHKSVELVVKNYSSESTLPIEQKVSLLKLKVDEKAVYNAKIIWESGDNNVCTVENGLIKSVAQGETIVKAKYTSQKGTESVSTINVKVSKELIHTEGVALADYTWDYGFEKISDKMFVELPESIDIDTKDIISIKNVDSNVELGEKGSLWIKKSESKEEKNIIIETKDFIFNVNLKVESSAETADVTNFDPMSFLPTHNVTEVDEFQGKNKVVKTVSLPKGSENGDIWYNHNGKICLNSLGIKEWRGLLVMNVWVPHDNVKLGGYVTTWAVDSLGKDIQVDNVSMRYDNDSFNLEFVTIYDIDTNQPSKLVAGKWNRVIIDYTKLLKGIEDKDITELSFYPSFARPAQCEDDIWEAYISDMVYMTTECYRAKFENENTYTISFNTFSSEKIDSIKVDKYSVLNSLPVINGEGNEFSHWEYNGKNADGMVVTKDMQLNAVYKNPVEYDIITYTLQLDGTFKETARETLTSLVGKKVAYVPELTENQSLYEDKSVLSGYIKINVKLELKVYIEDTSIYPDGLNQNGVVSIGVNNLALHNCTNGTILNNGLYDSIKASDKGAWNRRLKINDVNSNITSKDYIAFLAIYFDGTTAFDFKVMEGNGKEIMDTYDLSFNFVKEENRKIGEWYYIVTRFDGNDQSYFYLSDWYDVKILIRDVYVLDGNTKNTLFENPTKNADYTVTTYMEQADGTYLAGKTETFTGKVDETINYEPSEIKGYIVNGNLSVLSGVLKENEKLELKVYYTKEIDMGSDLRVTDGSFFIKEENSAVDFVYEKKAYKGNNNTYYSRRTGNAGSYGYRLTGTITDEDLNKYLVIKMTIPTGAKSLWLNKADFWQDGVASPYASLYHCMDFYKADGTSIDNWNDFHYDEWFYSAYYLDSEKVKSGKITISFADWVPDMEIYIDTISFVGKIGFESKFDYMPTFAGVGIKSSGIAGMTVPNNKNNNIGNIYINNVSSSSVESDRQLSIWGTNYFDGNSYIVFTIKYHNIAGNNIDFAENKNGELVSFDFYDADFNLVEKADRKADQWYYVVSTTTGHNNSNVYKFADAGIECKVTFGNYYLMTQTAKETKFPEI